MKTFCTPPHYATAAVLLTVISVVNSHADLLDKINSGASEASKALGQVHKVVTVPKPAVPPPKPSTKTNPSPATFPEPTPPAEQTSPNPTVSASAAMTDTNELAFPILPDGSFFLSRRIFLSRAGLGGDDRQRKRELIFGDGPALTGAGKMLLHLAHGVRDEDRPSHSLTIEDAVKETVAYRKLQDDFERRDFMLAAKPVFEQRLAEIRGVKNVTVYIDVNWSLVYSLERQMYLPARPTYERESITPVTTLGVDFLSPQLAPRRMPSAFHFPPDQAEKVNGQVKATGGALTVAMLVKGTFCSQEEFARVDPKWRRIPHTGSTRLLVCVNTSEWFLFLNPKRNTDQELQMWSMTKANAREASITDAPGTNAQTPPSVRDTPN